MSPIQPDLLRDEDFPVQFGRFTLLGLLGEGGMARVFRAELQGPSGFRKAAAVKIIRASVAARSEALRTSLINEARLGGLLHHPNIVDTYDFGDVDGLPFIAMEMVRGVGLDVLLNTVQPLPAPLAVEIGAQICAGLDHAHCLEDADVDTQLVHRDLKPSNVIVSRDGLVKVMDFGIAKATMISEGNTQTGMTKGTPAYMSPEQVGGEELDPRSDLFAMGAILYELVTGDRLFSGDSIMSVLMGVVQVEQRLADPAIMAAVEERAPGMAGIILTCLRKDRADRYGSAAELEHALRLVARELPPPPPLKLWIRDLIQAEGLATIDPSSGSLPINAPAPTPAPAAAAPASPGLAATMPQTVPQASIGARPVPPSPPATSDEVPATRAQIASLEQVPARGPVPKPRRGKKGGSPGLLLLLGLLVGGALAGVGVLLFVLLTGDEPEPEPIADLPGLTVAEVEPTPTVTPQPGLQAQPRATPRPEPRVEARPTPAPPSATPAPVVVEEPEPEVAEDPTPDPAVEAAAAQQAREEREAARRARREEASRRASARKSEEASGKKADVVPDPNAPRSSVPDPGEVPSPRESQRFRVASPSVSTSEGDDGTLKLRFAATVPGADSVTVHFNPRGASWISRPLKDTGGGDYVVNVIFQERNKGTFYYYFVAVDGSGKKAFAGTKGKPLKAVAK